MELKQEKIQLRSINFKKIRLPPKPRQLFLRQPSQISQISIDKTTSVEETPIAELKKQQSLKNKLMLEEELS